MATIVVSVEDILEVKHESTSKLGFVTRHKAEVQKEMSASVQSAKASREVISVQLMPNGKTGGKLCDHSGM